MFLFFDSLHTCMYGFMDFFSLNSGETPQRMTDRDETDPKQRTKDSDAPKEVQAKQWVFLLLSSKCSTKFSFSIFQEYWIRSLHTCMYGVMDLFPFNSCKIQQRSTDGDETDPEQITKNSDEPKEVEAKQWVYLDYLLSSTN